MKGNFVVKREEAWEVKKYQTFEIIIDVNDINFFFSFFI